uniref:Uncharacterized protein n=1 Tax=Candidatus Kentrum sp. SD TaxID=2126332 RepID=A0A450YWE6_9GAMM|nr:MAG: hypothetical protein BECKSD772F_GA0070984_10618 [Candidatus Kentron sp. SD]VFK45852.1 MAG: hypothetical protein BECKSD772E_GA0070983_10628 [Candidatus Kentron sp. SD]VFK79899.1 MAG: hypothetical protein BECKSD772D_GA0070982_107215 [Candidatus Kentron sp. SD]
MISKSRPIKANLHDAGFFCHFRNPLSDNHSCGNISTTLDLSFYLPIQGRHTGNDTITSRNNQLHIYVTGRPMYAKPIGIKLSQFCSCTTASTQTCIFLIHSSSLYHEKPQRTYRSCTSNRRTKPYENHLLLLRYFPNNRFICISNSFTFIWLRRSKTAYNRGSLTNFLLINTTNNNLRISWCFYYDPIRYGKINRM